MSVVRRHPLWTMVVAGVAIRLILAFALHGTYAVDILAFSGAQVQHGDWEAVYEGGFFSWPYPPIYLAWVVIADGLSDALGLSFHGVVKLVPILADVGIALAAYAYLGWRGASDGQRLAAAALVLLGPSFIAVSAYQGQIDSVAILPAVLAVAAWEVRPARTRAVESGLLVGLGAAIKMVPGLLALPLLACARSWREGVKLAIPAIALPLATLAPLYLAGIDLERITAYGGVPGFGGPSLVVNPGLGFDRVTTTGLAGELGGMSAMLADGSRWITAALLAALAAFLFRYRPAAIDGAVLLWLAVFAFSPNFFLSYMVWALPFFIMAGYLKETAILQAALLPATVVYYLAIGERVFGSALGVVYVASMILLWAFWVVATVAIAARIARRRGWDADHVQPPLVNLSPEAA